MPENLPAVPDDDAVEEMVFDGEVIDEPAPKQPVIVLRPVVHVYQRITIVVQHPHTQAAGRHALYVPAGVVVAWRRWRHARSRPERMMQQLEMQGDHAQVIAWRQQLEAEKQNRHGRLVKSAETVVVLARNSLLIFAVLAGLMLVLSVLLGVKEGIRGFIWPWETAAEIAVWAVSVGGVVLVTLVTVFGTTLAGVLHELGRRGGDHAPRWAAVSSDPDVDVTIDERAVSQALSNLRIPQIKDYLALGIPLQFIVPCRTDGRGTYCEVRLPGGLPALEIAKQARRERLAAGLYRHTKEVWPTTGGDNSHLKLWIADKGALEEGAGPYPLLEDGVADVFKGVPFGRTLRGDLVMAPLMERNTITGGMPGQGKSSAARVIMCGAALDPTAELWIMVPDINYDFELMRRRCSRYVAGVEDEHLGTIRDWLLDLKDEVDRRGELLQRHQVPEVTRKLASARIGLHPLFVLLEEAHVAINHETYGKEISKLLCDIVRVGRKRGMHVIVSTQAPTKDSMPRDVTRNCSNGIAFAVGDHVPNDALLGAGAYRAGHRATELIPGTDRGVAVVKGFSGERSEMVQVYFISVKDPDQVTPLIDRAMAETDKRGGLPGSPPPLTAIEARDLLVDAAEVIGGSDDKVKLADLAWRLKRSWPSWGAYKSLNSTELRAWLEREGVRVTNPKNVPTLDPADLREALAERDD